jgi:hypothetical protein
VTPTDYIYTIKELHNDVIHSLIHLSMALQPFVGPWPFVQCHDNFTQTVGLLGRVISPSQSRYLHTEQHKHRLNAHKHPCLEWDSNLRSKRPNEWRLFRPCGHYDRHITIQSGKIYFRRWMKISLVCYMKIMWGDWKYTEQCTKKWKTRDRLEERNLETK